MMARATGAAVAPPVPAWSERATATATRGLSTGANAMNQVSFAPGSAGLRGAGLAGDANARDLRGGAGARLDSQLHHRGELCRGLPARRLRELVGLRLREDLAVRLQDPVDDERLHDETAVGDTGGDHGHLQRRREQPLLAETEPSRIDGIRVRREEELAARGRDRSRPARPPASRGAEPRRSRNAAPARGWPAAPGPCRYRRRPS